MKRMPGFTLIEVAMGVAVFLLFAVGVYSALSLAFKAVYLSRMRMLETSLATQELERVRNLPFASVGTVGGVPAGVLTHTKVVTANGVQFLVTTTIRSIDDPYDGTVTSTPADVAPEDRKLVDISVNCSTCGQFAPVVLSTEVAAEGLESATLNGSLFIRVLDSVGLPVPNANVVITNNAVSPVIAINDVVGDDGWLRVIDTPTGTLSYAIRVSKSGYSSDYTITSSVANPSPTKLPASVASRALTTVNFAIDTVGSINVRAMDQTCEAIGSAQVWVQGQKLIGSLPPVYKYDRTLTMSAAGEYALTAMEWDTYVFRATSTAYDLAGTIPLAPFALLPGATQDVSVILKAHTTNSALIKVKDSGTGLPLSGASVRLTDASYDQTLLTGLGFVQQTEWSGGSGQADFTSANAYFSDDGAVDVQTSAGDVLLKNIAGNYLSSGILESSTFDLGIPVNFSNITFTPVTQATSTGSSPVLLQVASSNSSSPAQWDFIGPDGTDLSYYTATSTIISSEHNGDRYVRYKLYLGTESSAVTPQVSDVSITYTTSCVAPGQSFFSGLASGTYTLQVSHNGYTSNSGSITISGNGETVVNLSPL